MICQKMSCFRELTINTPNTVDSASTINPEESYLATVGKVAYKSVDLRPEQSEDAKSRTRPIGLSLFCTNILLKVEGGAL